MCGYSSPIMINFANNSSNYHLTSYTDGVLFDINATGTPVQVGWTEAGSSIGILALDRNGDGTINNGSELFGTATRRLDGSLAANGFEALKDLDVVHDGQVDANDPAYELLRVWFDNSHDGVSQVNELVPLSTAGIVALFTHYRETSRMDRNGNLYAWQGSALVLKNGRERRRRVFDVALITASTIE